MRGYSYTCCNSTRQRCLSLNLARCLHLFPSSVLLLRVVLGSLRIISSFSVEHKLQVRDPNLTGLAFDRIDHLISNSAFFSFKSQIYCESLVASLYAIFRKLWRWFANLNLTSVDVLPMYVFVVSPDVTVAW